MKKIRLVRNLMCLLLCMVILSGYTTSANAEEETLYSEGEIINEESIQFIFPDSSSDLLTRGAHFAACSGSMLPYSGGYIKVSGYTLATGTRDKVYISINLQKYTGSSWVTVYTCSKTAYNTDFVSTSGAFTVPTGYNYRIYGIGSVTHGGVTESGTGASGSAMVY